MMTMLSGLNAIAAQRGDGLRPELLKTITLPPIGVDIEMMMRATPEAHQTLEVVESKTRSAADTMDRSVAGAVRQQK